MKLTKNLMLYLIPILSIILIPYKAKALTDTRSMSGTTGTVTEANTGYREWVSVNQNIFGGYSDGRVMFTFTTSKGIELQEIYLENINRKMACTFGDNSGYSNNTEQFNSYSVECYADFLDDQLRRIHILYYNHTNPSYLYIPKYISYYSYDTPKSVISAINNSSSTSAIQALQQAEQQNTNNIINSINSQASQAHADAQQAHQDSEKMYNEDISESAKTQPNQDSYNNVQQQENQIYGFMEDANIDILNIGDTSAWSWILTQMTNMLNTHNLVMSMMISVLTIGIIKALLGR